MDEYSTDENYLKQNSQTSGNSKNSKKIRKVRKQKSNNDNISKSTENPTTKSKKKIKKVLNKQNSTEKTSDTTSEPLAIDITSSLNNDQNSFTKFHGHRPVSRDQSGNTSSQVNESDLNTESDFSSDLSQKVPGKLTKEKFKERQSKAINGIKPIDSNEGISGEFNVEISISSEGYSYTSENGEKTKNKSKGKRRTNRNQLSTSQHSRSTSNQKSNASLESESDNLAPQGLLAKQPRRRKFFDRDDNQNAKPRSIKVDDSLFSSSNINSSSLLSTNTEFSDESISQTPLPNEESFKKLQNKAILSIKSTNPREKSESVSLSEIPSDLDTTSTTQITDTNLSQVQKSDFEKPILKAINEIKEVKEVSLEDESSTSTFDNSTSDLTDQNKKEILTDKSINNNQLFNDNTKSLSGQNSKTKSNMEETKNNEEEEEEEEEDEDAGNDTFTHSQLNQTVDGLSDQIGKEQNEQSDLSEQFFNSEVDDHQAVREVKTKVDDLVIPESRKAYINRGIRLRPKEDNTEAVYGTLTLPENTNLQFDSEVSELDVPFITDKKKFKKSIVSRTPTNRIPSSIPSDDRRRVKKNNNNYDDNNNNFGSQIKSKYNSKSRNIHDEPSGVEYSEFPSFLSSEPSDPAISRDINIDESSLIQEDSMMFPTQFDVQQANSDDDGSLFEQFKRNVNFLSSSSSDEQDAPPTPLKTRSTPNNSVTEVVETTYTEIDSISNSSSNSKRHKDKTVTKGRIVLFDLSSSSSFDELDDDLISDSQERGIKNEFSIDNIKIDDNTNKPRSERLSSKPSDNKSSKTQNCYFDGNVVLKLTVVEARNLPQEEFTPLDPYCTVALSDKKKTQRTKTIRSTTKPIWDQQFRFNYNINKLTNRSNTPSIFQRITKQNGIFLYIHVVNEDKFSGDREISSVQLDLKDLKISQYVEQWIKLKPSGNFKTGGEIRLSFLVEPQTPISSISPRKVNINNNDDSDYLLSPRSQTPTAQHNPFAEPVTKRQQTTNRAHFNSNPQNQQKSIEKPKISQTPNFNYSQRPWTDSSSEASTIENQNNQNDTVTLTLADQIEAEEEEEAQYTDEEAGEEDDEEEEQNGYHTEIKPEGRRRSSKNNSENDNDDKFAADQDLLNNHDDSDDLSPIVKTAREDDEDGNSLNLNSLPTGDIKRRNIHLEEEELSVDDLDADYDESPPINNDDDDDDDEEDIDSNAQTLSSLTSGNVDDKFGDYESF